MPDTDGRLCLRETGRKAEQRSHWMGRRADERIP
jgi:hypothetical protein